ncbi:MAG TPA: cupin domain-containing protein, partial [Polyangiaceae bacterium]|nr:cupin domain-containing protein [Polyangiaceae bacterium]
MRPGAEVKMSDDCLSFERLLRPVTKEAFVRDYWQQTTLMLERPDPGFYAGLLSERDVESLVAFHQLQYSQLKIAQARPDMAAYSSHVSHERTSDTNGLYHSYAQGDSVVLNFMQKYWEPAARLCRSAEEFFHFGAGINAYITPQNSQGFPPHFDTHDAFVLQISGAKHWRIYEAWRDLPAEGEDNRPVPREALGAPTREVELRAGDLLYIPRGHVHEARTTGTASVHVTVGVRCFQWSDLLSELLSLATSHDVELRRSLPVGFMEGDAGQAALVAELPRLVRSLAESDQGRAAVGRLRRRLIRRMRPLPDAHLRVLDQVEHLRVETLVAKRPGQICHVVTSGDSVEVECPGNRLSGPLPIEPALRFIAASSEPFRVAALPGPLSDQSKVVLVKRAIKEGLLTMVEP